MPSWLTMAHRGSGAHQTHWRHPEQMTLFRRPRGLAAQPSPAPPANGGYTTCQALPPLARALDQASVSKAPDHHAETLARAGHPVSGHLIRAAFGLRLREQLAVLQIVALAAPGPARQGT